MQDRRRAGAAALPAILLVVGFVAAPVAWTLVRGLGSLSWVASNQVSTVVNSLLWLAGGVVGTVLLGLALALVAARLRSRGVLTLLLLLPSGVTLTVAAVVWRSAFAFRPDSRAQVGIVNEVVTWAGLSPVAWLTQEPLVNTVVLVGALVWAATGLVAYVLVVAIDRIPASRLDEARAAGASEWRVTRSVVVPALRAPLGVVTLAVAVVAVRVHDIVRVATDGSFGTSVLATESFDRSFVDGQASRGAALAVVLLLLAAPLVALALRGHRVGAVDATAVGRRRGRHSRGAPPVAGAVATEAPTQRGRHIIALLVASAAVVAFLVPLLGVVVTALRPAADVAADGWWNVVADPSLTLDNLRVVLGDGPSGGAMDALIDSLLVAVPAVAVTVALATLTAGALHRLEGAGATALRAALVAAAVMPLAAVVRPIFDVYDAVGLTGTLPGVWLAHVALGLPLVTLLVVRGAGSAAPGPAVLVAAAAVHLLLVWNDYLVAVTVLGGADADIVPSTVHLAALVASRGEELHLVAASALVTLLVPVVVLLSMRGTIVRALLVPIADERPTDDGA